MSTLRFISPALIGDAQLSASSVPETDHPAWSAGTTYAADARVIKSHRIWQSAQAGNVGHDPATDSGAWWVDVGPTNRWAMLDKTVGTSTTAAGSIEVTLAPGQIQALAMLDLVGDVVQVTMFDGATPVYDRYFDLADSTPLLDWWDYFFLPIRPRTTLVVEDLPTYGSATLRVRITGSGTVACGTLAVGDRVPVGRIRTGARVGITDYSRKYTDDFGVTRVVERSYARRMDLDVLTDADALDYITDALAAVRATPVVWIADDTRASLVIYGWVRDWGIVIAYRTHHECSITIEGLV